ncbi:MAG TPA: hypothetical protein VFW66_12835 [Gemmatimonadales bacterium]|nr:hypothetical protein [Gemmatimonadales bacterium]
MADAPTSGGTAIEHLLQERARFQQWLTKLDTAAGSAPPGVRDKVRADYAQRLDGVIDQLKSHGATINEELERQRSAQAELEGRRADAEEVLAEAGVRHAVGEYSDDEWRALSDETSETLEKVRNELATIMAEVKRLVEVQGLISASPKPVPPKPQPMIEPPRVEAVKAEPARVPAPEPAIEMLPDPTPDESAAAGSPPEIQPVIDAAPPAPAPGAPRFVPKPAPQPAGMDELAFLKSVSGERPRVPDHAGGAGSPAGMPVSSAPPGSAPAGAPVATQPSAKPGPASQQKTLKCGECGTLNRATEWYCERCGAELAAL